MHALRYSAICRLAVGQCRGGAVASFMSRVLYSSTSDSTNDNAVQSVSRSRRPLAVRRGTSRVRRTSQVESGTEMTVDREKFETELQPDAPKSSEIPQNAESQHKPPKHRSRANTNEPMNDFLPEEMMRFGDQIPVDYRSRRPRSSFITSTAATSDELYTEVPEFPSDIEMDNKRRRDQTRHAFRPNIDPTETSIILFPGQGSEFVGMGAKLIDFPNVTEMYKSASKILGYDLLEMCLHGPKNVLSKTVHAQPAVLVTSLAAIQKLKYEHPKAIEACISAAGYNVGEYSALVFAGALSFEDAVRLVKSRAAAMQGASNLVPGGMAMIHFGASGKVNFACHAAKLYCQKELGMADAVCEISAYLYAGCKVISGNVEALNFIEKNRSEFGITGFRHVPVSGAFHSRLMHSSIASLSRALSTINFDVPIVPVFSNVTGQRYTSSLVMKRKLLEQMWRPIRWEQTMHVLYGRPVGHAFPNTIEVGPGTKMGQILKVVNAKAYEQYSNVDV